MANKKINCPKCRRSIDINVRACPFCGAANTFASTPASTASTDDSTDMTGEDFFDSLSDFEDENDFENTLIPDVPDNPITPDGTYEDSIEEPKIPSPKAKKMAVSSDHRASIAWKDEQHEPVKEKNPITDERGNYNANHDGYYDDILPKINGEVDRILANRDKTIMKIIGALVGIAAIIVYLVITLS